MATTLYPDLSRAELLERLLALIAGVRRPHPVRVGIDGPDTAGKTRLADELADALGDRRPVIRASIDRFHRPSAERYRRGRDSPEGYYEDSFDYAVLRASLLEPLGPQGDRWYRAAAFDVQADSPVSAATVRAARDAVLLFDGVFLLRPEIRDVWDLHVFVAVGFDVVLLRAVGRDTGSREEIERRYRARYIPGQRLYLEAAQPEAAADAVVYNDDPGRPSLRVNAAGTTRSPARAESSRRPRD